MRRVARPDLVAPITGYKAGAMGIRSRHLTVEAATQARRKAEEREWKRRERESERRAARAAPNVVELWSDDEGDGGPRSAA